MDAIRFSTCMSLRCKRRSAKAAVDELAGTPVEALMFCLGDGRTVLHDTEVGELWGHNVQKWDHLIFRRAYQNALHLIQEGNDPLRIICDRAHEVGLLFYPTLLMQLESGERGGGGYDIRSSDFRLDNKHLEIGAKGELRLPVSPVSTVPISCTKLSAMNDSRLHLRGAHQL